MDQRIAQAARYNSSLAGVTLSAFCNFKLVQIVGNSGCRFAAKKLNECRVIDREKRLE